VNESLNKTKTGEENTMKKAAAKKLVNKIIAPLTTGTFTDETWAPIFGMLRAIDAAGFSANVTEANYENDGGIVPVRKTWKFEVTGDFKGVLYGRCLACFKSETMESYDVICYVS
jgi:hypothetical protein